MSIAQNRLELLLVELQEERHRAVQLLLLSLAMAVLALMTLLLASFALVIIFWDEHRVAVISALVLFYLLGTLGVLWRLRWCLENWSAFSGTLAELQKDKACFEEKE